MYTNINKDKENRIIGEKIYLRPITIDDSETIVKWRNQENVRKYFYFREDFSLEGQKKWFHSKVETKEVFQFIVCSKEDDTKLGCTYIQGCNIATCSAESGIFLGADDIRGKGVGKEALKLTVWFAFHELGLKSLTARAIKENEASINTHLSVGYKVVEYTTQKVIPTGELVDTVMMEIVNEQK